MKARYISVLNSKGNIFFKGLKINSNLLTNFMTDFTNLSLKLKLIIDSEPKEFHFVLNRDNGSFKGQHRIALDPSKSNCLNDFSSFD